MTDKAKHDYAPGFHGPKCLGGTEPHPECNTDRTSWFDASELGKTENYVSSPEPVPQELIDFPPQQGDVVFIPPPGLKNDLGKPSWTLLPFRALSLVVDVLTFGAAEYDRDNWQQVKPEHRYEDALFRHYAAWRLGERLDPKSGLPHLAHMACNALFILALKEGTDR